MKLSLSIIIALTLAATAYAATTATSWLDAGTVHVDPEGPHRTLVLVREAGVAYDHVDDTTVSVHGRRSSGYRPVDLKPFGVPTDAKTALLSFKAIFTKGLNEGTVSAYAFARRVGSTECQGLPGYENFPVDHYTDACMVIQTAGNLARDGDRTWAANYAVPLDDGRFEFSWGYLRVPGPYPEGDAVGVAVYLNGWSR